MRVMPSRPGSVPSSPLAGLPRPLDERLRPSRRRRLARLGLVVGAIAVVGYAGIQVLGGGPLASGGVTSGAASSASIEPSDAAVAAAPGASGLAPVGERAVTASRPAVLPAGPTAAPQPTPLPPSALTGYRWPLPHGRLTLPFGPTGWGSRIVDGDKFHDGMDLATFCGDRVVAAHDGVVLAAGRHYDHLMGWVGDLTPYLERLEKKKLYSTLPIVVVVDDGNGYRSIYAHFSKVVVKKGQTIRAGDFIGYEGMTGHATGCHVHYGLFSPLETATFGIAADVVKRMKTPALEIARVDPLLVLPPRPEPTRKPKSSPTASP